MTTDRIVLGRELLFGLIDLLNILFRQLNTTAGDAPGRLFRNGSNCWFIIDGSGAFLLVFGGNLLLLMRFDLIILVQADYFLNLAFDWKLLMEGALVAFSSPRAPKCHCFNSFAAF